MVVATQNSIEHEGTFPLPEAAARPLPPPRRPHAPRRRGRAGDPRARRERGPRAARDRRRPASGWRHPRGAGRDDRIHLAPPLKDFIVRLVVATREAEGTPLDGLVEHAVSPRGTLALAAAAKARAALHGRDHALPEDVEDLAADALSHRMVPSWRATSDGITTRDIVARALAHVRPWAL